MKNFQRALEDCLMKLLNGTATMDECLARYPEHAEQLKPLLQTVLLLHRGRDVLPSPTFSAYTRSAVIQYMRSHPRQLQRSMPFFQRTALTFTVLVAALFVTGTVRAQSALPDDTFYSWKRTSEQVWRAISLDPLATNIMLAERRLDEWIAVADDPAYSANAMNSYMEAISRLESTNDVESLTLIVPALESQQQMLNDAGLFNSELDDYLIEVVNSVPAVATTQVLPTSTYVIPTGTNVPSTATDVSPTVTDVSPTATDVPPTATDVPPTATDVPPTATDVPPTATDVPPTTTDIPPTDTPPTDVPTEIVPAVDPLLNS